MCLDDPTGVVNRQVNLEKGLNLSVKGGTVLQNTKHESNNGSKNNFQKQFSKKLKTNISHFVLHITSKLIHSHLY